jgi:hypothetical protein
MLRFLNNVLFLVLISAVATAQSKKDSTTQKKFMPTGIRVGIDVLSLIRTETGNTFSGYEVSGDIDFYRYYLAFDMGQWERDFATQHEAYANNGKYFRAGIDINFLKKDPEKNMFFFGVRYAQGTYSENLRVTQDPVWGPVGITYANTNINARWGELTTGLKVKMLSFFWMGYTARYKFGLNTDAQKGFASHDVPGYGKTDKGSTWGFNYYVLFRMPVRKQQTTHTNPKN